MHRAAVLVACLALLAGCGGFPGGDAGPRTTVAGPDGAGWPPTTERSGSDRAVAWLTADDAVDPRALATAHRERLRNRSYSVRWTATERVATTGTRTARTVHRGRFAAERGRYRAWVADGVTDPSVREVYADGGRAYTRLGDAASPARRLAGRPAALESDAIVGFSPEKAGVVADALAAFSDREASTYRAGDRVRLVVRSADLTDPASLPGTDGQGVSNASLWTVASPGGVVQDLRVRYDVVREGVRYTRVYELRVRGVGATSVDRPEWVPAGADDRRVTP